MKTASTSSIRDQILYDILVARNRTKPVFYLEYLDDDGETWRELENVENFSIQVDSLKDGFGEVSYIPTASSFSASLVNVDDIYTPESGNELEGVLIDNRPIRVWLGYDLQTATGRLMTEASELLTTEASEYFVLENQELIKMGIYYLDDPSISNEFGSNKISITGRDAWKKSFENSITSEVYVATDVGAILRDYLESCGIETSSALVPNIGITISVSDVTSMTNVRGADLLNNLLHYVNTIYGSYRIFVNDDGLAELKAVPTSYTAYDYEIDYTNHIISSSYGYKTNQSINRCDVFVKEHGVAELKQLVAPTVKTLTGSYTLSWVGDATYLSLIVDDSRSDAGIAVNVDQVNKTSIIFSITGSGVVNVSIEIKGCLVNASPPYYGSAISYNLHKKKNGITKKIINPFFQSDAECRQGAEKVIADFGYGSDLVATFQIAGNPLLEPSDRIMVTDKNANKKNLFYVSALSHSFDCTGSQFKTSLTMRYSGTSIIIQDGYLLTESSENITSELSEKVRIE